MSKIRNKIHKIKNFIEKGDRILEEFSKPHSKAEELIGSEEPEICNKDLATKKKSASATLIKIMII